MRNERITADRVPYDRRASVCYSALSLFDHRADCPGMKLRPRDGHGAEGWEEMLLPGFEREQQNRQRWPLAGCSLGQVRNLPGAPGTWVKYVIPLTRMRMFGTGNASLACNGKPAKASLLQ